MNSNFGQLRPNHFHAGLDIHTPSNRNIPLFSIEDGYVARIKVGTKGYGKVLYIAHPNGKTSVYAHQSKFADKIQKYAYQKQMERQTFEIDVTLDKDELKISKDELIGYSGNTGNSTGPHLHFEIRNTKNDAALNPLLFFDFKDLSFPRLKEMFFLGLDDLNETKSLKSVSGTAFQLSNSINSKIANYELKEPITVGENFGIAISATDKISDWEEQQIFGIKIKLNSEVIFELKMDSIPFEESRYINCFSDPNGRLKHKKIMKCFLNKNQNIACIKETKNNGYLQLDSGQVNSLQVEISDAKNNTSVYHFKVIKIGSNPFSKKSILFDCDKKNKIIEGNLLLTIPEKTAFNDYSVKIKKLKSADLVNKNQYSIEGLKMPLFKSFEIGLKPSILPQELITKLYIHNTTHNTYCGGKIQDEHIVGESKNFGSFVLRIDTIGPKIEFLSNTENILKFRVTDIESGINDFKMYVNGTWVLSEYEHKDDLIFHYLENTIAKTKYKVKLEVTDNRGNISWKEIAF